MIFLNLVLWTSIYKVVRYMAQDYKCCLLKDWSSNDDSRKLAFYAVSTVHSLIMSILPLYYYYTSPERGLIREFNDNELKLVDLSMSYFLWDYYYVYLYKSVPFFIHHTMGIAYMLIFKYQPLGGLFLYSIFLPEVTTPMLNLWTLCKIKKYPLFDLINAPFTYFYIFMRVFCITGFNTFGLLTMLYSNKIDRKIIYTLLGISGIYTFGNVTWSNQLYNGYKKWLLKRKKD